MPCNNDIKAQNYWQKSILSWIFQENVNFEITVKKNFSGMELKHQELHVTCLKLILSYIPYQILKH